ncbi:caspase family protein [Streptomyces sp. NPDC029674]|uniref:caspase, EACC1-associated type n=1 Tax=Streptomyces sp. NPDC029674 TaxID=3365297 RepID=UPI0038503393
MTSSFPDPARTRAVLIGVSTYEKLPDLPTVDNNVSKLKELLMDDDLWGLPEKHCIDLTGDKASSVPQVMQTLHTAAAEATDAFLVYFAGHGLSPLKFGLHLALPSGDHERLYNALDFNHIRRVLLEVCTARQRLVILDCCYGGRALTDHLGSPDEELADLAGIKGTYLLAAASATVRALAPQDETYTAFTGEVIEALDRGIPDGPDLLDTDSLFVHVRRELIAKGRPEPQQRADGFGHRIVLAHNRWDQAVSPEAVAYAGALSATVGSGLGTADLGEALGLPPAQVKRYLRGGRIAPKAVLDAVTDLLGTRGRPLPPEKRNRLHELRRLAQRASEDADTQLLYWREEADRLRAELEELARELNGSALVAERDRLLSRLAHAQQYIKVTDGELAEAREDIDRLRREVDVLRLQARRLLAPDSDAEREEPSGHESAAVAKVSAVARQEGHVEGDERATAPTSGPDVSATPTRSSRAPDPPPSASVGAGCAFAVLVAAVLGYLLIGLAVSGGTVALEPSGGRRPTVSGEAYIWDVAGSVSSTFAVDDDAPTDRLEGTLRLEAGRECGSKPVEAVWEITVDGRSFKKGTAEIAGRGTSQEIATDFPLRSPAEKVTMRVGATGAAGTCDTFGLVWERPRLAKSFDVAYAF